jgi:hypothetical protein
MRAVILAAVAVCVSGAVSFAADAKRPTALSDEQLAKVVAGRPSDAGLGNFTAETVGSAEGLSFGTRNFNILNAEVKSPAQSIFSDVGNGLERADQVNGKGNDWYVYR